MKHHEQWAHCLITLITQELVQPKGWQNSIERRVLWCWKWLETLGCKTTKSLGNSGDCCANSNQVRGMSAMTLCDLGLSSPGPALESLDKHGEVVISNASPEAETGRSCCCYHSCLPLDAPQLPNCIYQPLQGYCSACSTCKSRSQPTPIDNRSILLIFGLKIESNIYMPACRA